MSRLRDKSYKVTGIILSKKNYFETDTIVEIFTLEKGKIRAVVRGSRKISSKLAGSTELFTYGVFHLAIGKNLDIITSAISEKHLSEKKPLEAISYLFLLAEVLTRFLPGNVPNEALFEETYLAFQKIKSGDGSVLAYEYLYKTIVILGYALSLSNCSKCHKIIENDGKDNFVISYNHGGILCPYCTEDFTYKEDLFSENIIKLLKYIESNNFEKYSKVVVDEKDEKELVDLVDRYLKYIYQKSFNSTDFIKKVKSC